MRERSRPNSPVRVLSQLHVILVAFLLIASFTPVQSREDIRLPAATSEEIAAADLLPASASRFMALYGDRCRVFWDYHLDTPRYVSPRESLDLGESPRQAGEDIGAYQERVELAVRRFVDENHDFFGLTSGALDAPLFSRIGEEHLLLSYRQLAGSLPIRGASLRALVDSGARLVSVKAFLLRDAPPAPPPAGDPNDIRYRVRSEVEFELELGDVEAQLAFFGDDPRDPRPIWSVRMIKETAYPGEIVADLESNDLLQEREYVYNFDELAVNVHGYYPNPDDEHPNFFFQTPEEFGVELYPVEDVMIVTSSDTVFTDEEGQATVLRTNSANSAFDWILASGECASAREVSLPDGRRVEICEQRGVNFTDYLDLRTTILEPDVDCLAHMFVAGHRPEPAILMNDRKSLTYSARLMTFRHINRFSRHVDQRIGDFGLSADDVGPLQVIVENERNPHLRYLPDTDGRSRLCIGWYLFEGNGEPEQRPAQRLTPTVLAHEFAHHALFRMTRFRSSQYFDCLNLPSCDDRDESPDVEGSIYEGVTDAFASFYTDTSKFGFYAEGNSQGPLSFDIADPALRNDDAVRALVAKVLWEVREVIIEEAMGRRDIDFRFRRDLGIKNAEEFLYHWLAALGARDREERAFDLGSIRQELHDTLRLVFPGSPILDAVAPALRQRAVLRGDSNLDGLVSVSDAVYTLGYLFLGYDELCLTAMDANDNGGVDLSDGVLTLSVLFRAEGELRGLYPECEWGACEADSSSCLK